MSTVRILLESKLFQPFSSAICNFYSPEHTRLEIVEIWSNMCEQIIITELPATANN